MSAPFQRDRAGPEQHRELEFHRTRLDLLSGRERLACLGRIGDLTRLTGDFEEGEAALAEAMQLAAAEGDHTTRLVNRLRLAVLWHYKGSPGLARTTFRTLLSERDRDFRRGYADFVLQHLGKLLVELGEHEEAERILREALALREEKGAEDLIASTRSALDGLGERRSEAAPGAPPTSAPEDSGEPGQG